jgi:hypothetical protein
MRPTQMQSKGKVAGKWVDGYHGVPVWLGELNGVPSIGWHVPSTRTPEEVTKAIQDCWDRTANMHRKPPRSLSKPDLDLG